MIQPRMHIPQSASVHDGTKILLENTICLCYIPMCDFF